MGFNTYPNNPFPPSSDNAGSSGGGGVQFEAGNGLLLEDGELSVNAGYGLSFSSDGELEVETNYDANTYNVGNATKIGRWIDGSQNLHDVMRKVIYANTRLSAGTTSNLVALTAQGITAANVLDVKVITETGLSTYFDIDATAYYIRAKNNGAEVYVPYVIVEYYV